MIAGVVNRDLEATVGVIVREENGTDHALDAIIDTGFTGFITLPSAVVTALQLSWIGREEALLGDGSIQPFEVYSANVIWNGQPRKVEVNVTETFPLLGMSMILKHDLRIKVIEGGAVTIEALQGSGEGEAIGP